MRSFTNIASDEGGRTDRRNDRNVRVVASPSIDGTERERIR
jgi:hypothetical protein